ncbi:MAG: 4-hydroxy-tetrahydrodipicolinate synthase [bacterium]|nr:4-hydroxy-tetrahydrodipicolinate synthase [bacterium]
MQQQRRQLLGGAYTAIVTPFTKNGDLDETRLAEQIERQVTANISGIVPVGTTGESPTLSMEEHVRVIELSVKFANRKIRVLAGTGANSTKEAVFLTKKAEELGADGLLQVVPYYNKPSQEGLFHHFVTVAQATSLPIILYNIPGRCGIDITVDTVCKIKGVAPNIAGIKVANGSSDYVTELRLRLGKEFTILSGDDSLTLPFMAVGADGVVSVVSNIVPELVHKMVCEMAMCYSVHGSILEARELHAKLFGLTKSLFLEGNPVGVKYAMELLGWDSGTVRLPLFRVSPSTAAVIRKELVALGLLK